MSAIETEPSVQETSLARDESRLSMVAYWLERYRNASFATPDDLRKKFDLLIASLETSDARDVANAWFLNGTVPSKNRFSAVADGIRNWASRTSRTEG